MCHRFQCGEHKTWQFDNGDMGCVRQIGNCENNNVKNIIIAEGAYHVTGPVI